MKKTLTLSGLALAALLLASVSASAQDIIFSTPTTFNNQDQVIDNGAGSVVYAVSFGAGNGTTLPVVTLPSGTQITFGDDIDTNVTIGNDGITTYGDFDVGAGTDTTGNANLDADLNRGDYNGTTSEVTLNGLVTGQTYEVQVFAADDRDVHEGNTFAVADSTAALALAGTTAAQYAYGANAGEVGAQETGTFVATGSTESFYTTTFLPDSDTEEGVQINGLILETVSVPEPSTWALIGLGFAGLFAYALKLQRRSA